MDDFHIPLPPLTFWEGLRYSHDPRLVAFHFKQVRATEQMVMALTGASHENVRAAMDEIWRDEVFLREFLWRHKSIAGREPQGHQFMFLSYQAGSAYFHGLIQYALVRVMKPGVVVETGGTPGNSSAFMLRAMARNQHGELHTVDLPPTGTLSPELEQGGWIHEGMPEGQTSGWAVPEKLRARHHQHLGDAKELLPLAFEQVPVVDIFIHDSDHSYEHMMWEFETAWPHIRPGGVLLSDDIGDNESWDDFTARLSLTAYRSGGLGAARKPE